MVKNKITNEKSALKIINKEKLSKHALNILKNESKIMCTLRHPSVVEFKQIFENQRFVVIEMEYIPGGQLRRLIGKGPISDLQASQVIKSLLNGIAYIHDK